jgi:DNA-binding GntR family transcriptional regulator
MYLNLSGSNPTSLDEHEWILSLLENGEYAQAKHHLAAHLDRTRQCLRENMADERPARDSGQVCSGGYGQ